MAIPFVSNLIKLISSSESSVAGAIRYNGSKVQVSHTGAAWEDIVSGGIGGVTLATSYSAGSAAADQTLLINSSDGGPVIFKANAAATGTLVSSQNSSATVLFSITDNATQIIKSAMANGASAVALTVDTSSAWSTSGAKLQMWKNNNVEKASIDKDGGFLGVAYKDSTGTYGLSLSTATEFTGGITSLRPAVDVVTANGDYTHRWTGFYVGNDSQAATSTSPIVSISNKTAASLGNQKFSPMLEFEGHYWSTNLSASRWGRWALQGTGLQGNEPENRLSIFASTTTLSTASWYECARFYHYDTNSTALVMNPPGLVGVLSGPSSGSLYLYGSINSSPTGQIILNTSATGVQIIYSSATYNFNVAAMEPTTDFSLGLGTTTKRWAAVHSINYGGEHQTNTANGSITINAASGETYRLLANGNVTALTITANGKKSQLLTVILVQDAAGTSTWVSTITNAKLAGGTFTKTTTANAIDTLTFRWDNTSSTWAEISRTTNIS